MPGFSDDALGNDGDGDSLTKSKLNLNANKDKKKPFFKKVKINSNRQRRDVTVIHVLTAHNNLYHLIIR
jgi:hypothetical protein